ncbi:MAG: hypothetical protein QXR44_06040 [Thermoproteota archaeon]
MARLEDAASTVRQRVFNRSLVRRSTYLFFSLSLLLAYILLMNLVSPRIYFAVRRVSFSEFFRLDWWLLPYLAVALAIPLLVSDCWRLAAASLPVLAVMLFLDYFMQLTVSLCWILVTVFALRKRLDLNKLRETLSILMLVFTGIIFAYLLIFPFLPFDTEPLDSATLTWVKLYATLQPFGVICYVLMPFGAFLPSYLQMIRRRSLSVTLVKNIVIREFLSRRLVKILFLLSLVFSVYLSAYSYFPKLNPGLGPTGVDIESYALILKNVDEAEDPVRFVFANCSDRPLFYLFFHMLQKASGLPMLQILEFAPVFWLLGLTASYYYLSSKLFDSGGLASLAALLTLAGVQTTVGLYSSYQSNMVALIMMNILAGIIISWREGFLKYVLVSTLSFLTPLIHPYTSVYYSAILGFTLLASFWRSRNIRHVNTLVVMLASALLSNVFTSYMASGQGTPPLASAGRTAMRIVSFENLFNFTSGTIYLFTSLYSSFIANSIYLMLTLYGLANLLRLEIREESRLFMLTSSFVLLPLYAMDGLMGSRLFFNFPSPVFSALGAYLIKEKTLSILLIVLSLNFTLQAVYNLGVLSIPV